MINAAICGFQVDKYSVSLSSLGTWTEEKKIRTTWIRIINKISVTISFEGPDKTNLAHWPAPALVEERAAPQAQFIGLEPNDLSRFA